MYSRRKDNQFYLDKIVTKVGEFDIGFIPSSISPILRKIHIIFKGFEKLDAHDVSNLFRYLTTENFTWKKFALPYEPFIASLLKKQILKMNKESFIWLLSNLVTIDMPPSFLAKNQELTQVIIKAYQKHFNEMNDFELNRCLSDLKKLEVDYNKTEIIQNNLSKPIAEVNNNFYDHKKIPLDIYNQIFLNCDFKSVNNLRCTSHFHHAITSSFFKANQEKIKLLMINRRSRTLMHNILFIVEKRNNSLDKNVKSWTTYTFENKKEVRIIPLEPNESLFYPLESIFLPHLDINSCISILVLPNTLFSKKSKRFDEAYLNKSDYSRMGRGMKAPLGPRNMIIPSCYRILTWKIGVGCYLNKNRNPELDQVLIDQTGIPIETFCALYLKIIGEQLFQRNNIYINEDTNPNPSLALYPS